jgi:uncharacterized membrane protein YoaK (UPF0700 family)
MQRLSLRPATNLDRSVPATMAESAPSVTDGHPITSTILLVMTAVTGIVDAVSYLGVGRVFTANMTGNVVLLAFAAAGVTGLSVARSFAALFCFFAGAVFGGRLSVPQTPRPLLVETALLLLASTMALLPDRNLSFYCVIGITATAMGYRNAVVRKIGLPDLTTTVLTLTITGLGADSRFAGGENPRWRRRVAAILALVTGAFAGAELVKLSTALALMVAALITGSCAVAAFRLHRKEI